MAACVLHNFCLIHDDFDETYSLDDGDEDEDEEDGLGAGHGGAAAEAKRVALMNVIC